MNKLLVVFLLFITFISYAEGLPPILKAGFEQYRENGSKEAIITWIKGSSIDNSQDAISQSNQLNYIEDYFGAYEGYDLFKENSLGPRSHLYLVTINYGKGAVYAKFFTYEMKSGNEVLQNFTFNTEVDEVWPSFMVYTN